MVSSLQQDTRIVFEKFYILYRQKCTAVNPIDSVIAALEQDSADGISEMPRGGWVGRSD